MANFLEVVLMWASTILFGYREPEDWVKLLIQPQSFYDWRQPRQTAYKPSLFPIACLGFCLTPSWLLVKVITLYIDLVFFGSFPIGSRYPDYRLLASPAKWLFWNIPNHGELSISKWRTISDLCGCIVAEWSIARLQIEGARQEALGARRENPVDVESKMAPQQSGLSISNLDAAGKHSPVQGATPDDRSAILSAHVSYKCTSEKHSGRLFVNSLGIRFEGSMGDKIRQHKAC